MTILCIGTNHRTAPVGLRERLMYSGASLNEALGSEGGILLTRFSELVILSTCNRTELYGAAGSGYGESQLFDSLIQFVSETRAVAPGEFETHLYRFTDLDAVRHLCRVASGLDSLVIGESEILGQVSQAFEAAESCGSAGRDLATVFCTAVSAGRRARCETGIGRKAASISSVAVALAEEVIGTLVNKRVLVIGAGKMGRLAGEALRSGGVADLLVASRTDASASRLATTLGGRSISLADLKDAVCSVDVVITSTGAPGTMIDSALVEEVVKQRSGRSLLIIDIAVPRDVDPSVRDLRGVDLYDIDDLRVRIQDHIAERQKEVPRVDAIIEEEVRSFERERSRKGVEPLISLLRRQAEDMRVREVERALTRLDGADPIAREQIEHLSRSLVNKILHEPTSRLRSLADQYRRGELAKLTRELFGLASNNGEGGDDS